MNLFFGILGQIQFIQLVDWMILNINPFENFYSDIYTANYQQNKYFFEILVEKCIELSSLTTNLLHTNYVLEVPDYVTSPRSYLACLWTEKNRFYFLEVKGGFGGFGVKEVPHSLLPPHRVS